tara:strand:+ start:566 stop:1156 length:591 start_codon:yes stop_codon:yes gene_type:complete
VQAKNAQAVELAQQQAARLDAFGDLDPAEVSKMREAYTASQSTEERTAQLQKTMQAKQAEMQKQHDEASARLSGAVMKDRIAAAIEGKKLRLRPGASESLLLHAGEIFRANEKWTDLVPKEAHQIDEDGETLTVAKWIDKLVASRAYLFEGGEGGGVHGAGAGGGAKKQYNRATLTPKEKSQAIEEIRKGTAEWSQ